MPDLTNDMALATIGFGLSVGIGMGMILHHDGTTGGAAIIARILKDKYNIPVTKTFIIIDTAVIIASFFFFVTIKDGMYSILAVYVTTWAIAKYQEGFIIGYQALIFSEKNDEISEFIINDLNRGVTFLSGTGGFTKEEKTIILTIVDKKQIIPLKKGVNKIDPLSFVSISHTYETLGEGFTFEKNVNKGG